MGKKIPIILGVLLTILSLWVLMTTNKSVRNIIERLENLGYDFQLITYIATKNPQPSPVVAIIDIDDRSLSVEGQWPWPRKKMAQLVDALNAQGAAVIAFDSLFPEKQNSAIDILIRRLSFTNQLTDTLKTELSQYSSLFNDDELFAESLSKSNAVLAISFSPKQIEQNPLPPGLFTNALDRKNKLNIIRAPGYISNIAVLEDAASAAGFINIFPDKDGILRHVPLLIQYKNDIYPSLSLQAVISFLGEKPELITPNYAGKKILEGIRVGATTIPTNASGQTLIPFIGKSYTFPYYSATDVLHGKLPPDALLGKILFIGTSATGLGDLKATAIQNPFPGVEIQASVASGILQDEFSYRPAWTYGANVTLALILGLFATFSFPYLGPRTLGGIVILLPLSLLFLNNWIWVNTGYIISFLVPVVLLLIIAIENVLYGYLFESRRREHLKNMFGQYVPPTHIDEMLKSADKNYGLRGEDREMSVLFADIRNFTSISEGLSAANLVEMLNTFFTPMTEIIFTNHGTIDKYVGDLIMAFWGAPLPDEHHAKNAIASALAMQRKVAEMQSLLKQHGWPEIHIGIGINSGKMSVGDMGSQYRRNYTVLGDAVNLASRVEGLTKFYGVTTMVTEFTQTNQPDFVFRKLDKVRVKGKKEGIAIYEVVGFANELTDVLKLELQHYHQALEAYFQQNWGTALTLLETLHQQHPDTHIYTLYIERIQSFKASPPPAAWDGIYSHTSK